MIVRRIVTFDVLNKHGYTYSKKYIDRYNIPEYSILCLFPTDEDNNMILPNNLSDIHRLKPLKRVKSYLKEDGIYIEVDDDEYMNGYQFMGEGTLESNDNGDSLVSTFKLACVCGSVNEYRTNKLKAILS